MAIRNILRESDPFLHKTCRPVEAFDERLAQLLDDMAETLHKADGVGLAAPQVGVLRRVFIMDFGEGVIECVNPNLSYGQVLISITIERIIYRNYFTHSYLQHVCNKLFLKSGHFLVVMY